MRIIKQAKLRVIAGESIVMLNKSNTADMTKVISLNQSSEFLWKALEGKEFSEEEAVNLICDNYEVERERAQEDVHNWIKKLKENSVIED